MHLDAVADTDLLDVGESVFVVAYPLPLSVFLASQPPALLDDDVACVPLEYLEFNLGKLSGFDLHEIPS